MKVTVNGNAREIADGAVVADVVAELTTASRGIAVALNGIVASRGAWSTTSLAEGDRIEVLTAVQGG